MRPTRRQLAAALLAAPVLIMPTMPAARADAPKPVLFFAAASLQTALDRIAANWTQETGKKVVFSYASSSTLARQMDAGAPADLFASADVDWMDWADNHKLIRSDTRQTLLGNQLVLITAASAPAASLKIAPGFPLVAALGDSRLAIGEPKSVPAGIYAQASLTALGVWTDLQPHLASAESVRAALALVARGEAKYGIVYATDAHSEPRVKIIDAFPENTHAPIVYPFAVTAASSNPDAAAFLAYLRAPGAVQIFQGEGFSILKTP